MPIKTIYESIRMGDTVKMLKKKSINLKFVEMNYSEFLGYFNVIKFILYYFLIFTPLITFSQSEFVKGYETGYRETYCYYKQSVNCNPRIPIAPIPTDIESVSSYSDGYNRGINEALDFFYSDQDEKKNE